MRRCVHWFKRQRPLCRCFCVLVLALLVGGAAGTGWLLMQPSALPQVVRWPVSPALFDSQGRLFHVRLSSAQEYCIPVSLYRMGKWLPRLAVAVEDRRFYSHHGVDPLALGRAFWQNVSRVRVVSGASTITSQLVRIAEPRPRTLLTKALEFSQALRLEHSLSKDQILELYLNRAPMGGPFRGVEAAARGYFGKRAEDLSLAEAVTLVAMFKGPTYYRPDRNPEGLRERRDAVLRDLAEDGQISAEDLRLAMQERIPRQQAMLPAANWHFADLSFGAVAPEHWEEGGAPLITTLSADVQRLLENNLAESLAGMPDSVTAAGAIVENASGNVLAYVGNARFNPSDGVNWVDCGRAPRSPGSTLKPFVYLEAVEQGLLVPGSLLADTPLSFAGQAPRNFDRMYRGPVSAGKALSDSLNAPAVRVLRLIGGEAALHRLRGLGFMHLVQSADHYGDSLVLGGCEVTLLELAEAYATLANMGQRRFLAVNTGFMASLAGILPPSTDLPALHTFGTAVHKTAVPIKTSAAPSSSGKAATDGVPPEAPPSGIANRAGSEPGSAEARAAEPGSPVAAFPARATRASSAFSPAAAFLVTDMLHAMNSLPPAQREALIRKKRDIAFKTGTSYGLRDAWVCAYGPEHTLIVWLGNEEGTPHDALTGTAGAAPAAFRILRDIPLKNPPTWYTPPERVESFAACRLSGKPAAPFCPHIVMARRIAGVTQTLPCTLHRETPEGALTILPPELEEFARLRNLAASAPPTVTITSPRAKARYYLNSNAPEQKLALSSEGHKGRVHWFVNREFYAAQEPGAPLFWTMRPGNFILSLVDEEGRTASASFQIIDTARAEPAPLMLR